MTNLHKIDIFIKEDSKLIPFSLIISHPKKTQGANDYFCNIQAPVLFKKDKMIYGINKKQAIDLSVNFAKDMLLGRELFDEEENLISIEQLGLV